MRRCLLLSLGLILCCLSACATAPSPFVGIFAAYKDCRERYAAIDAKVDAAGVRDGAYYRVPGYPYLRSDRLLASFRDEIHSLDEVGGWLRRMREEDQEAREFEYMNLGLSSQEAANLRLDLLQCGRGLAAIELDDPKDLEHLKTIMPPPDDYSSTPRTFGLHALNAGAIRARVADEDRALHARFAAPLAVVPTVLWQPSRQTSEEGVPPSFDKTLPDELGMPGLTDSAWTYLAEKFAPALWMETAGTNDAPGAPSWQGDKVAADPQKPFVNFQVNFTRFGGKAYGQITYFFWFQHTAGLDGLIWRVTLDRDIKPVAYESMRASGAEHVWFPVQALLRRDDSPDADRDSPHFPQEGLASMDAALRLAAGSQRLDRVLSSTALGGVPVRTYYLHRYEELFTLPRGDGKSLSLFTPDGLARDSASDDPVWLWSSGIRSPGVARQYGRHAIDYLGRTHFDDPFLLENVFLPAPPQTAALPSQPGG